MRHTYKGFSIWQDTLACFSCLLLASCRHCWNRHSCACCGSLTCSPSQSSVPHPGYKSPPCLHTFRPTASHCTGSSNCQGWGLWKQCSCVCSSSSHRQWWWSPGSSTGRSLSLSLWRRPGAGHCTGDEQMMIKVMMLKTVSQGPLLQPFQ